MHPNSSNSNLNNSILSSSGQLFNQNSLDPYLSDTINDENRIHSNFLRSNSVGSNDSNNQNRSTTASPSSSSISSSISNSLRSKATSPSYQTRSANCSTSVSHQMATQSNNSPNIATMNSNQNVCSFGDIFATHCDLIKLIERQISNVLLILKFFPTDSINKSHEISIKDDTHITINHHFKSYLEQLEQVKWRIENEFSKISNYKMVEIPFRTSSKTHPPISESLPSTIFNGSFGEWLKIFFNEIQQSNETVGTNRPFLPNTETLPSTVRMLAIYQQIAAKAAYNRTNLADFPTPFSSGIVSSLPAPNDSSLLPQTRTDSSIKDNGKMNASDHSNSKISATNCSSNVNTSNPSAFSVDNILKTVVSVVETDRNTQLKSNSSN
ncbi:hypothetical protein SSS_08257 [Sarcoptes scabiei]|nr:hypothetical protein SSS_08257 [Sarcoptes scabiei]